MVSHALGWRDTCAAWGVTAKRIGSSDWLGRAHLPLSASGLATMNVKLFIYTQAHQPIRSHAIANFARSPPPEHGNQAGKNGIFPKTRSVRHDPEWIMVPLVFALASFPERDARFRTTRVLQNGID